MNKVYPVTVLVLVAITVCLALIGAKPAGSVRGSSGQTASLTPSLSR